MELFNKIRDLAFGKKVGLALGGGAARGLAHIGVLKVLEEEQIPIDVVAGTSAGSIIGSLYCSGYCWEEIRDLAHELNWGNLVSFSLPTRGLLNPDKLEKLLDRLVYEKQFSDLLLPFTAIAVDLLSGEEVHLSRGSVSKAVRASCSIPGVFSPTTIEDRILIDGGILNSVPADVAANMGADFVIGVDLNSDRMQRAELKNIVDVMFFTFQVLIKNNIQKGINRADVLIAPDLEGFSYKNMKQLDELLSRGEKAALEKVEAIKTAIGWRRRESYVGRSTG